MKFRFCALLALVFTLTGVCCMAALAASASATFDGGLLNSHTASATVYLVQQASVDIEKFTNGEDADDPIGTFVTEGNTITWTYKVTNTGNVTLTDVTVTDSQGVPVDCGNGSNVIATLAPGAPVTCTATGIAQPGQYSNTGTASTSFTKADGEVVSVTDSDDSHYYGLQGGQPSIQINSLTGALDDERICITGVFNITDDSESGRKPDGFLVGLDTYQVDWEYKKGRKDPYEPSSFNGSGGGWLSINGEEVDYTCTYSLIDMDGDTTVARELTPDENLVFDEPISIGYTCIFDAPITDSGFLRGTAQAGIFGRDKVYEFSQEFPLSGKAALAPAAANAVPRVTKLGLRYPNPSNPDTWIPFELAEDASVRIEIYDVTGRLVRTLDLGHRPAGYYLDKSKAAYWDGRNDVGESVSSGIYFYRFTAGGFSAIKRMVILK